MAIITHRAVILPFNLGSLKVWFACFWMCLFFYFVIWINEEARQCKGE